MWLILALIGWVILFSLSKMLNLIWGWKMGRPSSMFVIFMVRHIDLIDIGLGFLLDNSILFRKVLLLLSYDHFEKKMFIKWFEQSPWFLLNTYKESDIFRTLQNDNDDSKRYSILNSIVMIHYSRADEGILDFRLEWRGPYCPTSTNIYFMVRMRSMKIVNSMLVRGEQYCPSHESRISNVPESGLL